MFLILDQHNGDTTEHIALMNKESKIEVFFFLYDYLSKCCLLNKYNQDKLNKNLNLLQI